MKSPWCVHPKTGRVCVPIDPTKVDEWDPHTTGRFVISWRRANEGGDMYSRIGSVSGTTITWDDNIYEVGSNNGSANYEHHWDPKQSGQIIYCYNELISNLHLIIA